MCNCNIIEGQSCSADDACNTINTRCNTIKTIYNNINNKIENTGNNIEKNILQSLVNNLPMYNKVPDILNFCSTAKNACTEFTKVENVINTAKDTVGL